MPFRCKCGRTFEKPDTFSSHTSGCAPFHQRRLSSSSSPSSKVTPLDMSKVRRFSLRPANTTIISPTSTEQSSSPPSSVSSPSSYSSPSPLPSPSSSMDYPVFMPTALSIQNAFEGVRRRSLSYGASLK
ncbi:hypothetical protein BCR42DRAFT_418752 [Absidia repens]|uniref:Uncharacterized protein n=1 Tax=Absidia repens TaxID=90262 RepID=A0A1X2IC09_9FUNG|nr:hypothetical protein BCR42DRAFT_418752 [Absidia repens]